MGTKLIKCSNPKCGRTLALVHEDIEDGFIEGNCPYCGQYNDCYFGIYKHIS